jgi:RHS repeat-associated protein
MTSQQGLSFVESLRVVLASFLAVFFSAGPDFFSQAAAVAEPRASAPTPYLALPQTINSVVTLQPGTVPASAEPGVTYVNVTGSGFPAATISPSNVAVTLSPQSSGPAMTAVVKAVTRLSGSTIRVSFQVAAGNSVQVPTTYTVLVSGRTDDGSATFSSGNTSLLTINPQASLSGLAPPTGQQGQQQLSVKVTGANSNFFQGVTQASLGAGISIASLTINSLTSVTAVVNIAATAAIGPRTVMLTTGPEVAMLVNGFAVTAAQVAVPNVVGQTQTAATAAITGAGLVVGTVTQQSSSTVAAGSVISESPTAGTLVNVGSVVNLVIANNPVPTLSSISPTTATPGAAAFALTVNGTNFIPGSVVSWNGANLTTTFVSATQLTAQVPATLIAAAGTAQVLVFNPSPGGGTSSLQTFTIQAPVPVISNFSPSSAPVGTLVNISGNNFTMANGNAPQITLAAQSGGTIGAVVSTFTATTASFVIPAGAASGVFMLSVGGQTTNSSTSLTITAGSSFTLSAAPPSGNLLPGQSVAYSVSLASSNGFSQVVTLGVSGLPAGVTASFSPQQITATQTSILTLTAPANQAAGPATLTISGSATVQGILEAQAATVSLNVQSSGSTTFLGRTVVDDGPRTPIQGVTVKFLGVDDKGNATGCSGQTMSDAAGNFELTNLSAACVGPQLISYDGSTATSPAGTYAGVNLSYTLASGQVTTSPVLIHLPRIDTAETVQVQQNASADQVFTFRTIPNLVVTVYPGTTFTLANGTSPNPFPLIAVQVPLDRLPDQMPTSGLLTPFIVAFQPANAVASQPVSVNFPNTLSTSPGTSVTLMTLDPTRGYMVPYGTATVSGDGTKFIADADPAHAGHNYGLVHFDWHGPDVPSNKPNPGRCDNSCCAPSRPGPQWGDPVDVTSGLQVVRATDIAINGQRSPIFIERVYRTLSTPLGPLQGPFGIGTSHNYGYILDTTPYVLAGQGLIILVMPDGNQFPFNLQSNKTFTNSTIPSLRGAVLSVPSAGVYNLRFRDGLTYLFQPDGSGGFAFLNSITDPNGNTVTITHGNPSFPDQITRVTDPVGRSLTFSYDSSDRITSITDPIGRAVNYAYTSQGLLLMVTDPAGGTTIYTYDSQNRLTQIKDARGVVMAQNTYDANGRVIQQIQADGGVIKFAYTLLNPMVPTSPVLRTDVTDALGNTTSYRLDPVGFLLNVTDPTGQMRTFTRDPQHFNLPTAISGAGTCAACGDPRLGDQTFTYDATGNVLTQTDSLGNTTTYTYDPVFSKITSMTDPLGNKTTYAYDSAGNLIKKTDPNSNVTTLVRNSFGQVTQATDALGKTTTYSYDSSGNVVSIADPLGNKTSLAYDQISRSVDLRDPLGVASHVTYDALNRRTAIVSAQVNPIRFTYDPVGHLTSVTDEQGQMTSFMFGSAGRETSQTDPRGKTGTLSYDLNGNVTGFVDRRGQTGTVSYDALNRPTGQTYQDGNTVAFAYDANGRPVHVVDSAGGSFDFSYDGAGRLTSQATPFGTVQYSYDAAGRVLSRQVVGQSKLMYAYDPAGNVLSASLGQPSATFGYDAGNRLINLTRSNGVASQYSYDPAGKLISLSHSGGQGIQIPLAYSYDAASNRSLFTTNVALPQGATNVFDTAHRLTQNGATAYTYDDNGNVTSTTDSTGTTTYAWDSRNRLHSISAPNGEKTTFVYDFAGNLISQTDSGPTLNLTQNFVLDDLTNVAYINRNDGDSLSVLAGRAIDTHFGVVHTNGQVEYGLTDAQSSTVATVDQTGKVISPFSYEPYGKTTTPGNYPFQFTGRVPSAANLYYFRARYYSPCTGRFVSEDPLGFAGGNTLLYKYAGNNPTTRTDPTGLGACTKVCKGILFGVAFTCLNQAAGAAGALTVTPLAAVPLAGYGGCALFLSTFLGDICDAICTTEPPAPSCGEGPPPAPPDQPIGFGFKRP